MENITKLNNKFKVKPQIHDYSGDIYKHLSAQKPSNRMTENTGFMFNDVKHLQSTRNMYSLTVQKLVSESYCDVKRT